MNLSKTILIIGVTLLIAGLYFSIRKWTKSPNRSVTETRLNQLIDSIENASPEFEIGYGLMKLQQFERNQKSPSDSDLLTYHIFNNDVTARINNDLPPLRPDYNKMKSSDFFLEDFFPAFRKGQAKLRQVRIGCLIIKQIGKGKADSTILNVSKINLSEILYIYDGTDFGAFDTSYLKKNEEQLALGNMNTGNSILIPLYVTNLFDRDDKSGNPMGWEVITNTAYVPTVLKYSDKGKKVDINLNKVLGRPINID